METIQTIRRHVDRTDAVIVDLDKTLIRGRVAEGLGRWYLNREWGNRNYCNVVVGIGDMVRIKAHLRKYRGTDAADAMGLAMFYSSLVRNGLGERNEMHDCAIGYFKMNEIEPVKEIVSLASKPRFLATIAGSTAANAAVGHFILDGFTSNMDLFDSNNGKSMLSGIQILIGDGSQKLEAVERMLRVHKISLKNCTVIGDGLPDIPMMRSAGLSIASPLAKDEVRAVAKIHLTDSMDGIHSRTVRDANSKSNGRTYP